MTTKKQQPESSLINFKESKEKRESNYKKVKAHFTRWSDYPFSAAKVAAFLNLTVIAVRKRISELQNDGIIEPVKNVRESGRVVQQYKYVKGEAHAKKLSKAELLLKAVSLSVTASKFEEIEDKLEQLIIAQNEHPTN